MLEQRVLCRLFCISFSTSRRLHVRGWQSVATTVIWLLFTLKKQFLTFSVLFDIFPLHSHSTSLFSPISPSLCRVYTWKEHRENNQTNAFPTHLRVRVRHSDDASRFLAAKMPTWSTRGGRQRAAVLLRSRPDPSTLPGQHGVHHRSGWSFCRVLPVRDAVRWRGST